MTTPGNMYDSSKEEPVYELKIAFGSIWGSMEFLGSVEALVKGY